MAGIAEFDCGHVASDRTDEFTSYEDGLTVHDAGHVFFRHGDHAAAIRCMEFASGRGVAWAGRDVAVIEVAMGEAPRDSPDLMSRRRRTRRRSTVSVLAAVSLSVPVFWTVHQATSAVPGTGRDIDMVELRSLPDSDAQALPVMGRAIRPAATTAARPSRSASHDLVGGILAGPATVLVERSDTGATESAVIPDEPGAGAEERRVRLNPQPGARFLATLQSPEDAACTWWFVGDDGVKSAYRSTDFEVPAGAAERVHVASGGWTDMTAVVTSSGRPSACLLVDPAFKTEEKTRLSAADDAVVALSPTASAHPEPSPSPSYSAETSGGLRVP